LTDFSKEIKEKTHKNKQSSGPEKKSTLVYSTASLLQLDYRGRRDLLEMHYSGQKQTPVSTPSPNLNKAFRNRSETFRGIKRSGMLKHPKDFQGEMPFIMLISLKTLQ